MAFTKITGYGISETTDIHVGLITATNGVKGVGIFSGGTAIHSGIITSLKLSELELIKSSMKMIYQSLKVIQ